MSIRRLLGAAALALVSLACAPSVFAGGVSLTLTNSFTPSTVVVGGTSTTTMTVTLSNPNQVAVSGVSFSDTYPAGLVPDVVGAYTCSAGSAVFNGSGWAFNNVTLAAGASCSVPMQMHATITGPITNTTSQVTGTNVVASGPASATLNVQAPAAVVSTPTLTPWMLALLAAALAAVALLVRKRAR